jgi:Glyoxalase/Bleomycin resistance protein/Dioxygenase superfamily
MGNGLAGFGLRFHHLGLAVPAPHTSMVFLEALGYAPGAAAFDPLQNVHLAMRHHPTMPDVEVIWPGEGPSPIDHLIRRGHMIYHICYVTEDAAASLDAMAAAGLEVVPVGPAKPAALFGGVPVSFHSVDQLGLIELIHGEPRPGGVK